MKTKKPLPTPSKTSARATVFLKLLKKAKGKRVVVDLAEDAKLAMESLLEARYGDSQKEVISRSLLAVAAKQRKAR